MPTEPGYIEEQGLVNLLIDYRVWRGRFVEPCARTAHRSVELRKSPKAREHAQVLGAIEAKITKGDDLNAHLSTRTSLPIGNARSDPPSRRTDRDLLLSAWGVHHLHLATEMGRNGFTKRTGDVLFAVFRESDAYLLGIFKHPQHENWAAQDIFAVMVRNWAEAELALESRFAIGLSQEHSDDDRLELRKVGMNSALQIDGKVYSPASLGMSLDGTPLLAVKEAQQVVWELDQCRKSPAQWLAEVKGAPESGEWRPYIHAPVPGFVEHCGFLAESTFAPIGRLC
jgi:hypothetical protein